MISQTNHRGGVYIEPFAGGAGIAFDLLENNIVETIVINDYDKGIYSFWRAILTEPQRFINDINAVSIDINEWKKQQEIVLNNNKHYSYELGFATFYLNRTNRSGIIKGGVIGGAEQKGEWKLDARFNRDSLVNRVKRIAEIKDQVVLYNKDINSFLRNYLPRFDKNSFIYFDPPYYKKGNQLYMNYFEHKDHVRIQKEIAGLGKKDWIITYDDESKINEIYKGYAQRRYDLDYCASTRKKASELMIFSNSIKIPTNQELMSNNICINLR